MEDDDGNHAKKGKQEDSSADSSSSNSSSSSSSSSGNNNDTKILILSVCNSDLTPDEKVQVIRDITASNNNNNNNNSNNSKEAAVPETSNSVSTSTSISTPSTTSAAIAVQSDFAPFVGGVLTDRLIDEIGVLQSRLTESRLESEHKRLRVQITGVDGTPIYCDGSLKNAGRNRDDQILLDFDYGSSDGFPLSSLNIEIRLGGVKVQQFNIDDLYISFAGLYDEENRMEYIHFNHDITPPPNGSGPVAQVHGRIGPLPLGWGLRNTGDEDGMVLTDFLELVSDENNDLTPQTLVIIGLVFDEKAISGIMSLVNIRDMT